MNCEGGNSSVRLKESCGLTIVSVTHALENFVLSEEED